MQKRSVTSHKDMEGIFATHIYYSKEYDDFEGIIRNGKMINEELVKVGLAIKYGD